MSVPNSSKRPNSCEELESLNAKRFYGNALGTSKYSSIDHKPTVKYIKSLPPRLNNLFGPTQVWKVFKKQSDALEFARNHRNGLMTFAFQQSDGKRLFLVAHPKVFWHYDVQKDPSERCTYEIIPEKTVCKLYFDLEYDVEYNPDRLGSQVVNNFIEVITYFLLTCFNISVSRDQVLDLDSSTSKKFSRHLIFQSKDFIFSDSKSVGAFVSFLCKKIELFVTSQITDLEKSNTNLNKEISEVKCLCCKTKSKGCVSNVSVSLEDINRLFVTDRNGKKVLICDQSVYSRNRHFRVFQNTKWGKNSPLVLSKDNTYKPRLKLETDNDILEALFLDSLITFFDYPCPYTSHFDFKLINFTNPLAPSESFQPVENRPNESNHKNSFPNNITTGSPYPEVDTFINNVVSPGHIWRSTYFTSSSTIVYDIVGNRYCENIKRQHRSNNVKYVVNLENNTYYQKCHDVECSHFRSNSVKLPIELLFKLDSEQMNASEENATISDSDLIEAASIVEDLSFSVDDSEATV